MGIIEGALIGGVIGGLAGAVMYFMRKRKEAEAARQSSGDPTKNA